MKAPISPKIVAKASKLRKRLAEISDESREKYLAHALSVGKKSPTRIPR